MMHNVEKRALKTIGTAKVKISVCIRATWSRHSLFVDLHYSIHWFCNRTSKAQIGMHKFACVVHKLHKGPFRALRIKFCVNWRSLIDISKFIGSGYVHASRKIVQREMLSTYHVSCIYHDLIDGSLLMYITNALRTTAAIHSLFLILFLTVSHYYGLKCDVTFRFHS